MKYPNPDYTKPKSLVIDRKNKFNGWLVKKDNLSELINVSIKILSLKKNNLKKIIERAEKYAKEKFNVEKHTIYISKIYLNLIKL